MSDAEYPTEIKARGNRDEAIEIICAIQPVRSQKDDIPQKLDILNILDILTDLSKNTKVGWSSE